MPTGTLGALPAEWDFIVAGAGPAGSTIARLLAKRGAQVLIVDRPVRQSLCVGETLPPQAAGVLRSVGLLPQFEAQQHSPAAGIVSVWGQDEPFVQDFLFAAHGSGWHLNRTLFNKLLQTEAANAGARLLHGAAVGLCSYDGNGWTINITSGLQSRLLRARLLIDAGGRARTSMGSFPPRRLSDNLIAIAGIAPLVCSAPPSPYTLVEAVDEGWFYSALLPSGNYITAYMTHASLYAAGQRRCQHFFAGQLAKARLTRGRLLQPPATLELFAANSSVRAAATAPGWLAVGDAARSCDPLSGLGILSAIRMAVHAEPAAWGLLDGNSTAAAAYDAENMRAFQRYRQTQQAFYRLEQRWPASDFWRNQSEPSGDAN